MRYDREQASLAAWTDWMRKRRGADDPYKPTERVRREPADATRDPNVEERRRAQERYGRQGTMGVPSGLREEPLGQRVARLGAEVLPPVSVPAMWGAGKKAMRGDLGGALDDATAELLMAAAMPVAGRLKKVAKAVAPTAKNVAKANLTNESVATVFDNLDAAAAGKAAARGTHLKQNPTTGQYIGAPRGVDSPQKLAAMRSSVDGKIEGGLSNAAWYDRARRTAEEVSGFRAGMAPDTPEGQMASMFARGGAAYSPQATPPTEINSFLRQHNAKVLRGDDVVPRTRSQAKNVAGAYQWDADAGRFQLTPENVRLGKKTGPYADAKDPTVNEDDLYKTANDIWHGRVVGYTGSKSNPDAPFSRGFTPQEHGFLTGENLLMAQRAQQRGLLPPGYDQFTWSPRAAQAATWGEERFNQMLSKQNADLAKYEKDLAKFERAKARGKTAQRPTKPTVLSLEEMRAKANAGIDDATERQVAAMNTEFAPGSNTGMFQGFGTVPSDVQEQFARESLAASGERNPILSAFQLYGKPDVMTRGQWTDSATGEVSTSLTDVSRPLVGLENSRLGATSSGKPKRGGPMMDAASRGGLEVASGIEGVVRGQQGVGLGKFTVENSSMKGVEKTGAHIAGSPEELAAAKAALEAAGLNVMDYGDEGIYVGKYADSDGVTQGTTWNDGVNGTAVQKAIATALKAIPGRVVVTPGRLESGLTVVPWGAEGSGQVSRFLNETLNRPDVANAAQRLDAAGVPATLSARRDVADRVLGPYGANTNRADVAKLMDLLTGPNGGFQRFQQYVNENGFTGLPALGLTTGGLGALAAQRRAEQRQNQPAPRRRPDGA